MIVLIRREIVFNTGAILRKEMLEEMYGLPKRQMNIFYSRYSDGILYGLKLVKENSKIIKLLPGALKFNGEIYFQEYEINLNNELSDLAENDTEYFLCFKERMDETSPSIKDYVLCLSLENSIDSNCFPLAKVQYRHGTGFYDVCNETNTDVEIYGCFASKDGFDYALPISRVSMEIYELLCEKSISKCVLDYSLLRIISEEEMLSVSFINMYIDEYNSVTKDEKIENVSKNTPPKAALEKLKMAIRLYKVVWETENSYTVMNSMSTPIPGDDGGLWED